MNKQDALQKLTALEAETKALRAIIEAPDTPAPLTRWRPENTDAAYFIINGHGEIRGYGNTPLSNTEYAHGNCFKTQAQAEIAAKAVGVTLKICAAAFAADPDAGGYNRNQRRWSVVLFNNVNKWRACECAHHSRKKPIYVNSYRQAEQMAAILNAEGV